MAFDPGLYARVGGVLASEPGVTDRKMFGGVCFLAGGHMACGILGDALIVRVGPDAFAEAMTRPHARLFDFTGRPMTGWIVVDPPGIATPEALADWVGRGLAFVKTLPPRR